LPAPSRAAGARSIDVPGLRFRMDNPPLRRSRGLPHSSHCGAFFHCREEGDRPRRYPEDSAPSALLGNILASISHWARIAIPMVRRGWLIVPAQSEPARCRTSGCAARRRGSLGCTAGKRPPGRASLRGADLRGAYMRLATLDDADLSDAQFGRRRRLDAGSARPGALE
jgi:hypothetical protein